MTLSTALEVGLGLALLYYVLGLVVSYVTSEIVKYTELRAAHLEAGLKAMLVDGGKFEEFMSHPWIRNLEPKRYRFLSWAFTKRKVDTIPARTFALTFLNLLVPGQGGSDVVESLREAVGALPPGDMKSSLQGLISAGVTSLEEARDNFEIWFNDSMRNVSYTFAQNSRRIAIALALVVTLGLNVDSVAVATRLWHEPTLRAAAAAQIEAYVGASPQQAQGDLERYVTTIQSLDLPVFWPQPMPSDLQGWLWKVVGWLITWVAVAQGSSFWYDVLKRVRPSPGQATAGS